MTRIRTLGIVALLLPLLLTLSSCLRVRQEITIVSQDKIEITMDLGVQKEVASQSGQQLSVDSICDRVNSEANLPDGLEGLKLDSYEDDKYIGCKISGTTTSQQLGYITYDESSREWTFEMPGSGASGGASADMLTEFEFKLTFPGKALTASGNGKISGNTVTWSGTQDLLSSEGLKATGSNNPDLTWLWIVIAVVVVGGGALAAVLVVRNKNKRTAPPMGPGGPMPGQGYPGPGSAPGQGYPGSGPASGQGYPGSGPAQGQQPWGGPPSNPGQPQG